MENQIKALGETKMMLFKEEAASLWSLKWWQREQPWKPCFSVLSFQLLYSMQQKPHSWGWIYMMLEAILDHISHLKISVQENLDSRPLLITPWCGILGSCFLNQQLMRFSQTPPTAPTAVCSFHHCPPLLSRCTPDLVAHLHYLPDAPEHIRSWRCMAGREGGRTLNRKQRVLEVCSWGKSPPPF